MEQQPKHPRTLTPRVWAPFAVNVVLAGVFLLLDEREIGVGALLAALSQFGVGYGTRPTYPEE